MIKTLALSLAISCALAMPTMAAACSGSFALNPQRFTETAVNEHNLAALRSIGVNATRAEIWGGCIRAFVVLEDGREEMQLYEPINLRRVE